MAVVDSFDNRGVFCVCTGSVRGCGGYIGQQRCILRLFR